ncbi:glycoside hydrolase family 2 protein [Halovulum sp. GXIMD14794]
MADIRPLSDAWSFREGFEEDWTRRDLGGEPVALPHNAVDLPFDYFDETAYQRAFTYQRVIDWQDAFENRELILRFDGAMADAHIYVNGDLVLRHADGYTPFQLRLTDRFEDGTCRVTVRIDGTENPLIPPFGGRIDYLTYAGIYREAWLELRAPISVARVKVETPEPLGARQSVRARIWLDATVPIEGTARVELLDPDGAKLAETTAALTEESLDIAFDGLQGLRLWSPASPAMHRLAIRLDTTAGTDSHETAFGVREARFTPDGFFLNGERVKLMGLNRHQAFPFAGYAQGRAAQERDAEILKFELGCNIVRTSHYPQSPWFLDHCDRIGLMVLEEIPGWQHIGGAEWKDETVENVRRMIERDWNHPSIILWGVRINESPDDHDLYSRTNALAHELDSTRQTGGIRKDVRSELLEDVYTFNDFILGDFELPTSQRTRTALRDPREVTGLDRDVPYIVTEYNGHMYPTKSFDQEQRQIEHVTRHLEIIDAAHADERIAGCIGWCMFDYNTHKDFGSGDRVCHHGVMTMFREPKFAAYAYASQAEPASNVVLKPVTFWARGERNIGGTLPLMVLTNCDRVELRVSDGKTLELVRDRERFAHLPHPPMMLTHDMVSPEDLGRWGQEWPDAEVVGFVGGKEAACVRLLAAPVADRLQMVPDRSESPCQVGEVRVIVRALDQAGNTLPFLSAPLSLTLTGPGRIVGPSLKTLRGGTSGVWIRPEGPGTVTLTAASPRFEPRETAIQFT